MTQVRVLIVASLAALMAACAATPPAEPVAPVQPQVRDLSGNWILTVQSQFGAEDSQMTVQQTGNQLSGTIKGQAGTVPYTGAIDGDAVTFSFTLRSRGMQLKIDQAGTLEGDSVIKGKSRIGEFAEGTFSAKKTPP